jgi:hypothetical protein
MKDKDLETMKEHKTMRTKKIILAWTLYNHIGKREEKKYLLASTPLWP